MFGLPWDDVDGAGERPDLADGRDRPRICLRGCLDLEHELGGGAQSITPPLHGHRASVPRPAHEADLHAALAVDGGDYAHRQVSLLQHRPLLDVDFAVAQEVLVSATIALQRVGVAAEGADRLPEGHAYSVL